MTTWLRIVEPDKAERPVVRPFTPEALERAAEIISDVERNGDRAVRMWAERLGDIEHGQRLVVQNDELKRALGDIEKERRALLERTAERITTFAEAQRRALEDVAVTVDGGRAEARWYPVQSAGCYAPGGRFPLPSSLLMTALTARAAGVDRVVVASPRPSRMVLAAAALAGAEALVAAGGAQAVAALAFGVESVTGCDVVVGPGNSYVTAAKYLLSDRVGIDMMAGPSELVAVADGTARPELVAADLLAQAEHDPEAFVALVSTDAGIVERCNEELGRQLNALSSPGTAKQAIRRGFSVIVKDVECALRLVDRLAPEHVSLHIEDAGRVRASVRCYGAMFAGERSTVVFGDYGAGPNHVLPTGGSARFRGGLSVADFMAWRTSLTIDSPDGLVGDTAALARIEGLEAHARAAEIRGHT
ncbi:MAG: histidinol dehydrogenase [Deltaproteobacteria bacterium]|nr:MAG: histidinol dehydrogenase [Deltaproteobacteria bacterium]